MERIDKILRQRVGQMKSQTSSPGELQRTMQLVAKYGDVEAFMKRFTPDCQKQICGNPDLCYFGDFPTLAQIRSGYGINSAGTWLLPQLYNLSEYCGCKEKLKGKPIEDCADVIAMEFYYLKVSELMLFFHRFKTGRYGRFYGSVDPLVITTSLREFVRERAAAYERHDMEEREAKERSSKPVTYEEYCLKEYGEIKPRLI